MKKLTHSKFIFLLLWIFATNVGFSLTSPELLPFAPPQPHASESEGEPCEARVVADRFSVHRRLRSERVSPEFKFYGLSLFSAHNSSQPIVLDHTPRRTLSKTTETVLPTRC